MHVDETQQQSQGDCGLRKGPPHPARALALEERALRVRWQTERGFEVETAMLILKASLSMSANQLHCMERAIPYGGS